MTCYHPLRCYRARSGGIVFNRGASITGSPIDIACGQCIGCRLERSRQWAVRCMHESQMHSDSCFITLTYDNNYLPEGQTLVVKDFQDFMKRLRKRVEPCHIRFYAAGEYGEQLERPHYHACIFGYGFTDRQVWRESGSGETLYRSSTLEDLWPFGHSSIGHLTYQSAAYCARYIMGKLTGEAAAKYEPHVNLATGEVLGKRVPPFNLMSRRPGIGHDWYRKFVRDCYPSDFLVHEGRKMRVPRYYDVLHEIDHPEEINDLKLIRKRLAHRFKKDTTPDRLRVREQVKLASLKSLSRSLEG